MHLIWENFILRGYRSIKKYINAVLMILPTGPMNIWVPGCIKSWWGRGWERGFLSPLMESRSVTKNFWRFWSWCQWGSDKGSKERSTLWLNGCIIRGLSWGVFACCEQAPMYLFEISRNWVHYRSSCSPVRGWLNPSRPPPTVER